MSTKLQELLEDLRELDKEEETNLAKTVRDFISQGPNTRGEAKASVDIDRDKTTERHRIGPRVQISIGTYSLAAGTALMIQLPRWARQVIIQNNSDLGGTSAVVSRSIDGTPATAGDFTVRQNSTVIDDVFTHWLSLYCASAMTVNGNTAGGLVVEVSS